MTRHLIITLPIATIAVAAACATTPDPALAEDSQEAAASLADQQKRRPPPRPPSCESNDDCVDACPDGSQGCTCHETPHGKACIPTCSEDSDCPDVGEPELRCHEGVCKPPPGPPPPTKCSEQADCADACPPGSKGCVCHDTPHGKTCAPSCSEADDCPGPDGAPPATCEDGICRPPPPPPH